MKKIFLGLGLLVLVFFTNSCSRMLAQVLELGSPENRVIVEKNVMVPMRDGFQLATDIYKPRAEGKYPVVLCRLPYNKNILGEFGRLFAQRGYIFVIQDCRATYHSEGEVFIPFVYEEQDGMDTVKWISQQEWFNGNLGAWGASYFGYTQWAIASNNPYLKCFYPQITTPSIYKLIFTGGGFHYRLATGWSSGVGKQNTKNPVSILLGGGKKVKPEEGFFNKPLKPDLKYSFEELGKMEIEELAVKLGLAPASNPRSPYPDATERLINLFAYPGFAYHHPVFNFFERYKQVKAPALMIAGWYDIFLKGQLDDFVEMKKMAPEPARSGTRIIIGPWAHASLGDPNAEKGARALEMYRKMFMIEWFDHWMKGEKSEKVENMAPIRLYVMGKNIWRDEYEWPLARTQWTPYYFHSKGNANTSRGDGWLSSDKPAGYEPPDEFTYDPKNPVPTVGGNNLIEKAGAMEQKQVEKREDVLVYTSAPVEKELEITGPIKVILYASSTARDTDFTAKLCVVKKDGRSLNLADGIVRARYRESYDHPSLTKPGKIYQYEIDLWATSYAFQPGEKIRVQISSSNFPRFDRNSNCAGEGGKDCVKIAHQSIYHTKKYPTRIILPVIP